MTRENTNTKNNSSDTTNSSKQGSDFPILQQIENYYKPRDKKSIYYDKQFTSSGIDYTNYIPMRFDSINNLHIKQYYTINGWYVLWYLMANSYNKYFIKINISTIMEELNLSDNIVKKTIKHLQDIEVIKIYTKEKDNKIKNINTILHISISYYLNNTYKEFMKKHNSKEVSNGYRAIPVEYINNILSSLSANQWSILSVLFVRYSWHTINNEIDPITGEIYNYDMKCSYYAFPVMAEICNKIGITKPTLIKELYDDTEKHKALINNQYKIITKIRKDEYKQGIDKETYANRISKENNRYYLMLFERYEYLYHNIYNVPDKRNKEIINKIKVSGYETISQSEEQYILNNRDYVEYAYGKDMKEYDKWVKNNNTGTKEIYSVKCKEELRINT